MSGPLPALLLPITIPLSWGYGLVVRGRNRRFDGGRGVKRLPRPVISVGNITTGGVGKTPMVAWIVEQFAAAGLRPAVALRGYAARSGQKSDEEAEYAERLPGVAIAADPDRHAALSRLLAQRGEIDCIVLDDGFQHRRQHRSLDLVLIDAALAATERLLPAGHLREPPASLRRADAVIVTHARASDAAIAAMVETWHGRAPLAWTDHHWPALRVIEPGGAETCQQPSWLSGKRLLTMLGVGQPLRVRRQIEDAGATIAVSIAARDHQHYGQARLAQVRRRCEAADAMLVTGKDWVKIRPLLEGAAWPLPIVIPELRLRFLAGEDALRRLVLDAARG